MDRSSTSSVKLSISLLAARDNRQERLARLLAQGFQASVFLSLNIPGADKAPPGAGALFDWALGKVLEVAGGARWLERGEDLLGPFAVLAVDRDPLALKQACIHIEASQPWARLVDIDVYSAPGEQIGRSRLGFAARACLLCDQPAVDCMRRKSHSFDDVIARAHELLARFRA